MNDNNTQIEKFKATLLRENISASEIRSVIAATIYQATIEARFRYLAPPIVAAILAGNGIAPWIAATASIGLIHLTIEALKFVRESQNNGN